MTRPKRVQSQRHVPAQDAAGRPSAQSRPAALGPPTLSLSPLQTVFGMTIVAMLRQVPGKLVPVTFTTKEVPAAGGFTLIEFVPAPETMFPAETCHDHVGLSEGLPPTFSALN